MATLEEFGPYLLLKKLGEDSLGETFRAGRIGAEGLEQVVLLRVFNGRNVNGARLWERIAGRRAVQEALKNPNLGDGVGLGEVRGIPYVAYDYVSGKSLTQLLVQASTENQPIPLDHALLIVERVSLGLATAYETKVDGQRLVHGFVVPHLVMISNEGEARLLGFEASPGLVDLARGGAFGSEVTRYLAPEARTSGVAEKADDIYSLGVLLYELATCRPLPEPGEQGFGPILESAHIPGEGGPLPAEVARLIGRSLAPRGERVGDAVSWHKAAAKLMAESGYNATAFNLAFFMHNLFRTDIERESREIEAEKTLEIPASALAGAAARPAAGRPSARPAGRPGGAAAPAEAREAAEPVTMPHPVAGYGALSQPAEEAEEASSSGGKGLWIGLAAALLLLAGGGAAWWFLMGPGAGPSEQELAAQAQPAPVVPEPVVEEPPPEPAGPSPEEIQTQIAEMIDSRSEEMESKFRQQYDERIQQLQKELEAAEKDAAERERLERERLEREAAEAAEQERLAAEAAEQERLAAEKAEQERLAAEKAAAEGTQAAADGGAQGGARAAGQRPPEAEPKVKLGDLVSFGPGVNPPGLISIPEVRYPPMARKLGREATVEVRLLIDETGKVARTETVGNALGYGFEEAAMEAAGRAKFRPATKDGVRVKMWTSVKLRFENP